MSVLRSIESKLESLFEGVFGRAFRSNVQPVEIARKLVKEMDDHRSVSVSRVYVPNEYTVYLSPVDREQFAGYEDKLLRGAPGLPRRARPPRALRAPDARRSSSSRPTTTSRSAMFGIATRLVRGPRRRAGAAGAPSRAERDDRSTGRSSCRREPPAERAPSDERAARARRAHDRRASATSSRDAPARARPLEGLRHPGHATRTSRAATPRSGPRATSYTLVDLDSTNGIEVDGKRVAGARARGRDRFTLGSTEVIFSRETH